MSLLNALFVHLLWKDQDTHAEQETRLIQFLMGLNEVYCHVPPILSNILYPYRGGKVQSFVEVHRKLQKPLNISRRLWRVLEGLDIFQESFRIPQKVQIILERDQSVNNLGTCKVIINCTFPPRCQYKQRCHSFVNHHSSCKSFFQSIQAFFQTSQIFLSHSLHSFCNLSNKGLLELTRSSKNCE